MKILVIGGSGLIGSKVVPRLRALGHDAISASPSSGVNTVTGEGLDAAMAGVDTVLDLSNSPSFADKDVLEFFERFPRVLLWPFLAVPFGFVFPILCTHLDWLDHDKYYTIGQLCFCRRVGDSGAPDGAGILCVDIDF